MHAPGPWPHAHTRTEIRPHCTRVFGWHKSSQNHSFQPNHPKSLQITHQSDLTAKHEPAKRCSQLKGSYTCCIWVQHNQGCIRGDKRRGGGFLVGEEGGGSLKNPPPPMVSGLKGQGNSFTNAQENLRPKAEEKFSPGNGTENLWAASRIGRGGGNGGWGPGKRG